MTGQPERPRVLFVSGVDGSTRRYRCYHHQEQLALEAIATDFRESDDPQLLVDVLDYDVFVLHRVPHSQLIATLIDLAHLRGKAVVFETDDLVFDPAVYDHIGFVDTLSPEAAREYREDLRRLARTLGLCDCVITTTQYLADQANECGKAAYVHRNACSTEMVRISERASAARVQRLERGQGGFVVLGYFSGTGSHNRDFRVIAEPLLWALQTYPHAQLHVSGHLELGPEFSPFLTRIRRAPYVSWRELPHLIARMDVNLAPLELDNPFCQAKSENKFIEAALVGVPTLASCAEAYRFAISHGENGLLAGSSDEWRAALRELLDNPERRESIGQAARRSVYARYLPEHRAPDLSRTIRAIVHQYGHPSASQEQVLRAMAVGAKRYAQAMRTGLIDRDVQTASMRKVLERYEEQLAVLSRLAEERERTIEAIMRGRVMRLMTGTQRWCGRIWRKQSE